MHFNKSIVFLKNKIYVETVMIEVEPVIGARDYCIKISMAYKLWNDEI